ncbi:MAG TPA: gliding motility lipoprotein GldD [Sunxiuqinia sp.]|nr:gliding motility lipoprotein GldD [Sunxiuqinia sp.]
MRIRILLSLIAVLLLASCHKKYTPKPRGYFRIEFPKKSYHQLKMDLPYSFDVADYSNVVKDKERNTQPGWINIVTPQNKAYLHISYARLKNNLPEHIEESRKLAYNHSVKADAIQERLYVNPQNKVYGTIYYIDGNAASPVQFYLTDSIENFLRGALYIREIPNIDSLRPVIEFLKPDIIHLIETTTWKK